MGKNNKCSDLNLNDSGSIFFWGLIILLFLLVIGNFILTMSIISFFKIGMGMESIKLVPELKAIKFYGIADFNRIYKKDGVVESFRDAPMVIEAHDSFIKFDLNDRKNTPINRFMMGINGTEFKGLSQISIADPDTNLPIFASTNLVYKLDKPLNKLEVNVVHAAEVVSAIDKELKVDGINIHVRGIEGTTLNAKQIFVSSHQEIFLKSSNGSIKILSLNGIYIDRIASIPVATAEPNRNSETRSDLHYKLCACYPKGNLYRVPLTKMHGVKEPCRYYDSRYYNPCL